MYFGYTFNWKRFSFDYFKRTESLRKQCNELPFYSSPPSTITKPLAILFHLSQLFFWSSLTQIQTLCHSIPLIHYAFLRVFCFISINILTKRRTLQYFNREVLKTNQTLKGREDMEGTSTLEQRTLASTSSNYSTGCF